MAHATEVTPVMSDEEALGWTIQRAKGGPLTISAREAARSWGWPDDDAGRMRVTRRLRRWEEQGLIIRTPAADGRQTITLGVLNATVNSTVNIALVQPAAARIAGPVPGERRPFTLPRVGIHHLGAAGLAGLALFVAFIGLRINAAFGASLGRTPDAAALFAGLAWAGDVAALLLPTVARALWRGGHRGASLTAWGIESIVVVMAWLAAVGFAAVNVADTTAGRAKIAEERTALAAEIRQMTTERAAIGETRAVTSIEAEIQVAQSQSAVAAVWSRTGGCRDVTQPRSGEACGPLLRLRQARGEAERRDAIDAGLREKQAALAALPAVTTADPQADAAASLVTWASRGFIALTAADVAMVRIAGLTLLQLIPGLLMMLAASTWGLRGSA